MSFIVRADGTVDAGTIRVVESSGYGALDAAAMAEAATWRFLPGTKKGKAVASPHKFRVVFELRRMPQVNDFLPEMPEILQAPQSDSSVPLPDPDHSITQPPYPEDALAAGAEGDVILQFTVEADGFVDPNSIVVKKSSGFPSLDQAAVNEAAVNWRFRPATLNGRPISAPHRFRVVFEIPDGPPPE
jgi:protein TonB